MNVIETHHLTKTYGKNRGITDLNLTVEENDFFGFIGPNGAGKSTTIRTLLGLITATSGTAQVLGMEAGRSRREILFQIGYLPGEAQFYPGMRVHEVLKFSADLHKKDCKEEAGRLCERLNLDPSRKVDELSLGNRKKVGIVCALQHCPPLYIMDEPTGGLDPLMQHAFYELLQERHAQGATVFLSCHILSEVERYCRHAAVIREGKLLVCDSIEKLGATGLKKVSLRGISQAPALPGVQGAVQEENGVTFYYSGKPQDLLKTLSALPLQDISISNPDLEEVFMHYYQEEGKA